MKQQSKVCLRPFLSIFILFLICACQGRYKGASYGAAKMGMAGASSRAQFAQNDELVQSEGFGEYEEKPAAEPASGGSSDAGVQTRKLVKRAELRLRVEDPAETEKPLLALMGKFGAWPASTEIYENSRNYSIRVPSNSYDVMLSELAGLGRILRRAENTEDVTLRYYDLEGRLSTKRELLKTYQSYLGKAQNINDIMTVEGRIADLQHEIDWTGTQLRNLASLVDYSTINVEISGPVSAYTYSKPTLGERLAGLFGSFGDVASSALVVLMGIIIYGVPAILIVILLFWLLFGQIGLLKKLWRLAAAKR